MPKTYADNAYNRSCGRVGMAHGSMVMSRSSGGGSVSSGGGGGGSYSGGGGGGGASTSGRTYVDNAQNRGLGRVGMPHGSMVNSRSSSSGNSVSNPTSPQRNSTSNSTSQRTYVDNAENRRLGRVGMPHGSMVNSRTSSSGNSVSSSSQSPQQRVYVDNAENRRLNRVGLPYGSQSTTPPRAAQGSSSTGVYVDNALNRRLGRVGAPLGSMPSSQGVNGASSSRASPARFPKDGVYKDTPLNRRLNRVNKPLGSCKQATYVDNQLNRMLNRVGLKYGTAPVTIKDPDVERIQRKLQEEEQSLPELQDLTLHDMPSDERNWLEGERERKKTVKQAVEQEDSLCTDVSLFQGEIRLIQYSELSISGLLGAGATAKVSMAKLRGSIVAVKEMRKKADTKLFSQEAVLQGKLNHTNIVKLLAAVVNPRCLVMEYVHDNLFKTLFIDKRGFSDPQKDDIAIGISQGLKYLHENNVAHCDLKALNILLQYSELNQGKGEFQDLAITAKLADFGLSRFGMDPYELDKGGMFGTLNYMPPEVMRGEKLTIHQRCLADIYSLGLVMLELFSEERNFKDTQANKIKQMVCRSDYSHPIPRDVLEEHMADLITMCLDKTPTDRPKAEEVAYLVQFGRENSTVAYRPS